jgi:transcriptional regulator with XRE-family HTH domain
MPSGSKAPPGPLTQEVAAIIRERLARKQWPQARLADAIRGKVSGVSAPQLSRMLNGTGHIDMDQLDAICAALDLDPVRVLSDASLNVGGSPDSVLRESLPGLPEDYVPPYDLAAEDGVDEGDESGDDDVEDTAH